MPLISWTKALETGHEPIDNDHRQLVELLNQLQEASRISEKGPVIAVLNELKRHTEEHFAHEERLMQAFGYEDAEAHRAEHRLLFIEVAQHIDEFAAGRIVASSIALYMQRWLIHHIVGSDRQLGAALVRLGARQLAA